LEEIMAELILTFEWDGTVKKETKGFTGSECTSKTKFIDEALGGKTKNLRKKAIYYESKEKNKEKLKY
jgi:hypothetical protein